ncbi:MAG: hypothetical protein DDT32_01872 [Syntrophomonadaceae bacterium]|nr:hypothetical protein [Bacillota bacterium]MBT9148102.1 hypothetical protein [Bacillota bacterium]
MLRHWKLVLFAVWFLYIFVSSYRRTARKLEVKGEKEGSSQAAASVHAASVPVDVDEIARLSQKVVV